MKTDSSAITVSNSAEPHETKLASVAQLSILTQTTPKDAIKHRKGKGGRSFRYLPHAYVVTTLNRAFAFKWSFEIRETKLYKVETIDHDSGLVSSRPFEMEVIGRLTVHLDGLEIVKEQVGKKTIEFLSSDPNTPVSLADAKKAAGSDSLKKCATLLGLGIDMLAGGEMPFDDPRRYETKVTAESLVVAAAAIGVSTSALRELVAHVFGVRVGLFDELEEPVRASTIRLLATLAATVTKKIPNADLEDFIAFAIETDLLLSSAKDVKIAAAAYEVSLLP